MIEAVIIIILFTVIAFGTYHTIKKFRKGGGCCGEHEAAEKQISVKDKNKSHYPYSVDLKISGMTCQNCAKRIENALNSLDGIWAKVDLNSNSAHILMKQETDIKQLCSVIAKTGYSAERKE